MIEKIRMKRDTLNPSLQQDLFCPCADAFPFARGLALTEWNQAFEAK
jgi:hypothetical protein